MPNASDLPIELVHYILELAVRQSTRHALPWAMSLLVLSRSIHDQLAPHVYYNLSITHNNSDAFLANPGTLRYLCYVHTLQFMQLSDPLQQRAWASATEHIKALTHVTHFRGPRKIMAALAAHATFLPTHWRSDPPFVTDSILGHHDPESPRVLSRLTHFHVAFVSPMRVKTSGFRTPPAITHVCIVPHVVANPSLFLNEVAHGRDAPRLERLVIRLGFMRTAHGRATRATCAKLLRAASAKWKDPRVYLDESTEEYDLDDDEQWSVGEQLWRPDS